MPTELTILGSNSALPLHGRHPSAQVLSCEQGCFLIDCGEGTQIQLLDYKIKRTKIDSIFISHMHGDHIYGLPGLLSSYNHFQRASPITVYGPEGIKAWIEHSILLTGNRITFDLQIHEFNADKPTVLFEKNGLTVTTVPLTHRIPTSGFLFSYKGEKRHLIPEKLQQYAIPKECRKDLVAGKNYVQSNGQVIPNEELSKTISEEWSYAYISDSIYLPHLSDVLQNVDVMYHESTYLHELLDKAEDTKHSTAKQAAILARDSKINHLLIGHFSSRYTNLNVLLDEAKSVFPNTSLALEGRTFKIPQ